MWHTPASRGMVPKSGFPARCVAGLWTGAAEDCSRQLSESGTVTGYNASATQRLRELDEHVAETQSLCSDLRSGKPCVTVAQTLHALRKATDPTAGRCAIIFIGDSISFQPYHAAICALLNETGSRSVDHTTKLNMSSALAFFRQHPSWRNFTTSYAERYPGYAYKVSRKFSVYADPLGDSKEQHLRLPISGMDMEVHLVRLWRFGNSRFGPGVSGSVPSLGQSLFEAFLEQLPRCSLVLYGEGMHHNLVANQSSWPFNSTGGEPGYRSSLGQALDLFERFESRASLTTGYGPHGYSPHGSSPHDYSPRGSMLSSLPTRPLVISRTEPHQSTSHATPTYRGFKQRRGPLFRAWETVAQHFDTPGEHVGHLVGVLLIPFLCVGT